MANIDRSVPTLKNIYTNYIGHKSAVSSYGGEISAHSFEPGGILENFTRGQFQVIPMSYHYHEHDKDYDSDSDHDDNVAVVMTIKRIFTP